MRPGGSSDWVAGWLAFIFCVYYDHSFVDAVFNITDVWVKRVLPESP